jgi:hypothetical protein
VRGKDLYFKKVIRKVDRRVALQGPRQPALANLEGHGRDRIQETRKRDQQNAMVN